MDNATIRILNTISSSIGDSLSINQLTERIKDTYGSAYYANIYGKIQELKNRGLLNLELIGRASNVQLNFENALLVDTLSDMEIEKKLQFLSKKPNVLPFFGGIDRYVSERGSIQSITAINPLKNTKLNRIELLFLLNEATDYLNQTIELFKEMLSLQRKYNFKVNNLIFSKSDFLGLLTSDEVNPVREALSNQINFYNPQAFWSQIKQIAQNSHIRTISSETKPLQVPESDLTFNLNRFGYSEFGASFVQGKKFCIEYITTSLLLRDEARGIDAIAVILSKNNFNSNLLSFLSQKYEVSPKLLGIMKVLQQTSLKPEVNSTITILKAVSTHELPVDKISIRQKLELYNAL